MDGNANNPEQTPKVEDLEQIKAELEALRQQSTAQIARHRELEQQLEESRAVNQHAPQLPTTQEGWNYALQVAQLRAQADEELVPYLNQLYGAYNQWSARETARKDTTSRHVGRVDVELTNLGFDPDSDEGSLARGAIQNGMPYETVKRVYIDTLKKLKLEEAGSRAKEAQNQSANRGSIEGGQSRSQPPVDGDERGETDPDELIMEDMKAMLRSRAPSSMRLAQSGRAARPAE